MSLVAGARRAHRHPLLYRGSRLECPICDGRFRAMLPGRGRRDVQCPACGSYERMRALWLFLRDELGIEEATGLRVLHFAPERSIRARMEAIDGLDYLSADLEPGVADVVVDITAIPPGLGPFDLVIASHVLEHVPDDRRALAEIFRVLAPGGTALLVQPVDFNRASTFEDFSITDPARRAIVFNQHNHVRIYGRDIAERMTGAGFSVTERRYTEELAAPARARYALQDGDATAREDVIFVARRESDGV